MVYFDETESERLQFEESISTAISPLKLTKKSFLQKYMEFWHHSKNVCSTYRKAFITSWINCIVRDCVLEQGKDIDSISTEIFRNEAFKDILSYDRVQTVRRSNRTCDCL